MLSHSYSWAPLPSKVRAGSMAVHWKRYYLCSRKAPEGRERDTERERGRRGINYSHKEKYSCNTKEYYQVTDLVTVCCCVESVDRNKDREGLSEDVSGTRKIKNERTTRAKEEALSEYSLQTRGWGTVVCYDEGVAWVKLTCHGHRNQWLR